MGCAEGRWSEARRRGSDARSLCQPMPAILLAIGILANISSAGRAGAAVPCGEVALEIAMSSNLESRGLSKDGTFISLSGNPYDAYLYCAAYGSMSLRFLGQTRQWTIGMRL